MMGIIAILANRHSFPAYRQKIMNRNKGFTLVELMVTVVVVSIVVAVAIPSFSDQIKNNRSEALGEEFASALNFARMEAVKRVGRVSLCPSDNGAACTNSAWTDGWIIFVDYAAADNAAPLTTQGGISNILRRWNKAATDSEISVQANNAAINYIRFTGLGALARLNNPPTPVIVEAKLNGCKGDKARRITVGVSGIVNVAKIACDANP